MVFVQNGIFDILQNVGGLIIILQSATSSTSLSPLSLFHLRVLSSLYPSLFLHLLSLLAIYLSLFSPVTKLLEKYTYLHSLLLLFCISNTLISPFQFGFLPYRSTISVLSLLTPFSLSFNRIPLSVVTS